MNWHLITNSFAVAAITAALASALGFAAALCFRGLPRVWRRTLLVFAVTALAMPPFLVTNCWLDLLGANGVLRAKNTYVNGVKC